MHFFNNLLWFFGIGTKPIPKQISTPFQQTDNHSTYNGYFFQYGDQMKVLLLLRAIGNKSRIQQLSFTICENNYLICPCLFVLHCVMVVVSLMTTKLKQGKTKMRYTEEQMDAHIESMTQEFGNANVAYPSRLDWQKLDLKNHPIAR